VSLTEDFFDDHFPMKPIMPGTLILEGMAQLAGLLLEAGVREDSGRNIKAILSMVERAKFRSPARPGDSLEYRVEVVSVNDLGGSVRTEAFSGGKRIAEATLLYSFHEFENPILEERQNRLLALWKQGLPGE
jgi:3-hydroxyacyl-[acyl-carrier-protein] dehydratase